MIYRILQMIYGDDAFGKDPHFGWSLLLILDAYNDIQNSSNDI